MLDIVDMAEPRRPLETAEFCRSNLDGCPIDIDELCRSNPCGPLDMLEFCLSGFAPHLGSCVEGPPEFLLSNCDCPLFDICLSNPRGKGGSLLGTLEDKRLILRSELSTPDIAPLCPTWCVVAAA